MQIVTNNQTSAADFLARFDKMKNRWLEKSRAAVRVRHAADGYSDTEIESLATLQTIGEAKRASETLALLQVDLLYTAFTQGLYTAMGFGDIYAWLDSVGLENRGRFNQLLRVAVEVIPWCQDNKIMVDGVPVDMAWFRTKPGGKCLVSRAVAYVGYHREIEAFSDGGEISEGQRAAASQAMAAVFDSSNSAADLRAGFKAARGSVRGDEAVLIPAEFVPDGEGGYTVKLKLKNPDQLRWLGQVTGGRLDFG